LKIALIHSHLNDRGGSQRYVIEIANNLIALGLEVDIYCYQYNKKSCYPELTNDLGIYNICTREESENTGKSYKQESLTKSVLKKIYKNNIMNSIVNSTGIDYLYSLYVTQKNAKDVAKLIITNDKKYDLIFAHEEPLSIYAAIKYKNIRNIPIYWFCYDTIEKWFLEWKEEHKRSTLRRILLQKIYFKYDKYLINKYIDRSAVLDNNMSNRYKRLYGETPLIRRGGVPESILEYNKENKIRKKYNLSDDMVIIFSLTRFINYRRVHDIFDMYEKLPSEIKGKVFIYLNSPITDEHYYKWCMEKYKKTLSNKNIVVSLDYPNSDKEMYDMYLSSDIFIFPNENQTWGHAPLEAMGCGVTTIVSTGCGVNEVIKKISSEEVYNVTNTSLLAQRITELIKENKYNEIGAIQKEYVKNNLTWKIICEIFMEDFKKLTEIENV
jgi:glycosyltransferase involved in cell wall biosynthesis